MLEIPNSHLRQRHSERAPGAASGVSLQDANLLKIEVTYGYQLSVPWVGKMFTRAMRLIDNDNGHFYTARRIPLKSVATVRMQSPAQRDSNLHFAANSLVGTPDPTTTTTAAVASQSTCDPHGISEDLDADVLDNFFPADDAALMCTTTVESIGSLYENQGTGVTGQSSVSEGSFTDCTA